jgi:cytochrome c biogenesis protein CcdA
MYIFEIASSISRHVTQRKELQVLNKGYLIIPILLLLSIQMAYSSSGIVVEFLYYVPSEDPIYCPTCPTWIELQEAFIAKNETITRIQADYEDKVTFNWTKYDSPEGWSERRAYLITEYNALIIKNDKGNVTVIAGDQFNETNIRTIIDAYLQGTPQLSPESQQPLAAVIAIAFSFGFFETFSPCLIVLLSFVLSYSLEKATKFKDSMFQIGCFGIGFVGAALLLGLTVAALSLGIGSFYRVSMLVVCVFAIFFGLYQTGIFKRTFFETKPIVQTLAKRYAFTYGGLLALGFAFYFLDPCIAPIFFAMLPLMSHEYLPLIILAFSAGVILPFIFIGLLSGSISKLTRVTYKHKSKIRAVSGLILVGYGVYLLILFFVAH